MNDDRLDQAENETLEVAHSGDRHDGAESPEADEAEDAQSRASLPPIATNAIRTTSPYAPDDIHEGQTFEQRDPATLRARTEAERLIH